MQIKLEYLSALKFNLETWRRELRFHFDEMDTFQEKLEEIACRELNHDAQKGLEIFQNRIMIEKAAIAKLKHRCKAKMKELQFTNLAENMDGRMHEEQHPLRDDMRTYIKLHYDLKEEMMSYFSKHLRE
jgi:hypothetical protein